MTTYADAHKQKVKAELAKRKTNLRGFQKVKPKKEQPPMRPGKTNRDRKTGAWSNRFTNQQARADKGKK